MARAAERQAKLKCCGQANEGSVNVGDCFALVDTTSHMGSVLVGCMSQVGIVATKNG